MEQVDERIFRLAIAIGIGFLVGLQREWISGKPIGLRSFALIATLGGATGMLEPQLGVWPIAVGLAGLAFGLFLHAEEVGKVKGTHGVTTEIAALVVFILAAAATLGYITEAVVLGGLVTLLLHWKQPLHALVSKIGKEDFQAISRFVLVALVVLPILPNQTYGWFEILNPFQIWLMAVLIVAINLSGYIVLRIAGNRTGAAMAGILGGLISSTATTASYAGKSKKNTKLVPLAAIVICVASTLVYARIMLEIAVVAPGLLAVSLPPLLAFSVCMIILVGIMVFLVPTGEVDNPDHGNPAQLKVALVFAAIYGLIIFTVAAVKELLGIEWIYLVGALSGLTDVDALTLSISQLFQAGELDANTSWRVIFIASLANLVFKMGVVAMLGNARLKKWISISFGVAVTVGILLLLVWP